MRYFVDKERTESVVIHRQVEIPGVWLDEWFGCWERAVRQRMTVLRLRTCGRRCATCRLPVAQ